MKHVVYVYLGNKNGRPITKHSVSVLPKEAENIDDEKLYNALAPYTLSTESFTGLWEYNRIRQQQRKAIEAGWTLSNWHIIDLPTTQDDNDPRRA